MPDKQRVYAAVLREWMLSAEHFHDPYPNKEEEEELMRRSGLDRKRVRNWFVNNRKRLWKPLIRRTVNLPPNATHGSLAGALPADIVPPADIPTPKFTSTYRGVCAERGKWRAQITILGKKRFLGTYATEQEAAAAYDYAARRYHGAKAITNFPDTGHVPVPISPPLSDVPGVEGGAHGMDDDSQDHPDNDDNHEMADVHGHGGAEADMDDAPMLPESCTLPKSATIQTSHPQPAASSPNLPLSPHTRPVSVMVPPPVSAPIPTTTSAPSIMPTTTTTSLPTAQMMLPPELLAIYERMGVSLIQTPVTVMRTGVDPNGSVVTRPVVMWTTTAAFSPSFSAQQADLQSISNAISTGMTAASSVVPSLPTLAHHAGMSMPMPMPMPMPMHHHQQSLQQSPQQQRQQQQQPQQQQQFYHHSRPPAALPMPPRKRRRPGFGSATDAELGDPQPSAAPVPAPSIAPAAGQPAASTAVTLAAPAPASVVAPAAVSAARFTAPVPATATAAQAAPAATASVAMPAAVVNAPPAMAVVNAAGSVPTATCGDGPMYEPLRALCDAAVASKSVASTV